MGSPDWSCHHAPTLGYCMCYYQIAEETNEYAQAEARLQYFPGPSVDTFSRWLILYLPGTFHSVFLHYVIQYLSRIRRQYLILHDLYPQCSKLVWKSPAWVYC